MPLLRHFSFRFKSQNKMGRFDPFGGTFRVFLLGCVFLVSGCLPNPFDDPSRLEVNDHLRAACYPWGLDDLGIDTMLISLEADRNNGWTRDQQLQMSLGTCNIDPEPFVCTVCATALIDQVYGD